MEKLAKMDAVSIAIASIGRPSLADTLRSLAKVTTSQAAAVSVVVADDSPDGAATRLVEGLDLDGLPVTCLAVASGNISTARNALLDAVAGDWIVFVDDDEWVEPDWLERLFVCQREYAADVVIGPVHPAYPDDAPEWLVRANLLHHDWGHRGKRLKTGRGGNTLARMDLIRGLGLRFDPALGVTGGEDTAFFAQAASNGAVIVVCDDAMAHEHVPPERLKPSYILRRAVRSGQSYAIARRADNPGFAWRGLFALDAAAKCAVAAFLALVFIPFDRAAHFRMRHKLALNYGKLRAVFGLPLAELYRRAD
jgi:succinoglycan biosynthesis protein ExoM